MLSGKLLSAAVLLSLASVSAWAADVSKTDQTYYFDEVVVTATGKTETLFTSKSNTQVITAEQIERMHYKDVREALRHVSGMQFADYPSSGYDASGKFGMNGSNTVKILLNGMPVSISGADNMGTPQSYVRQLMTDMDNIERIEVMKGSASILYGTDAVGGVINIITKSPGSIKTNVGVEGGNFKHEEYKVATQGKINKTLYRFFAQKYHDGSFDDGNGDEWDNHKNGETVNVSLDHEFSEGNKVNFDYRYGNEDFTYNDYAYGYSAYDNGFSGKTKTNNVQLKFDNKFSDKITNQFMYNFTKYEHNSYAHDTLSGSWGYTNADSEMHNNWKTNVFKDLVTYANKDNIFTLGLECYKSEDLKDSKSNIENKAVFIQDQWKFGKGWDLTVGGRFDSPDTDGEADLDDNWAKSINLGYKFNEKSNMYVGYNDYFVLPTMVQLYNTTVGNKALEAAKGKNYEIGFNHKFTPKDVVSVHYYYRKADQSILSDGMWPITHYYNGDVETKNHGFDIQYDKTFDGHWHAKLGWANNCSEDSMAYVLYAKNQVTLGVDYTADKWNVGLDMRAMMGAAGEGDAYKTVVPQGHFYMLADVAVNYQTTKNAKVYIKVNNIFDKYYADQFDSSGYANPRNLYARPGRTWIVGMNWSF